MEAVWLIRSLAVSLSLLLVCAVWWWQVVARELPARGRLVIRSPVRCPSP